MLNTVCARPYRAVLRAGTAEGHGGWGLPFFVRKTHGAPVSVKKRAVYGRKPIPGYGPPVRRIIKSPIRYGTGSGFNVFNMSAFFLQAQLTRRTFAIMPRQTGPALPVN